MKKMSRAVLYDRIREPIAHQRGFLGEIPEGLGNLIGTPKKLAPFIVSGSRNRESLIQEP